MFDERMATLVRYYMPSKKEIVALSDLFSAFADQTRVALISALSIGEMCVTDLSDTLRFNQSTVSHQLRFLKDRGVVKEKRRGKTVFYALADQTVCGVMLDGVSLLQSKS